ncbi:putative ATP-binding cassette transporter [Podospora australis]|uniref:ATP-binding cassette transporter n=1 Tax=Podospora australis TaxID=1536484 RepID=A0AAN7AEP8_9PEZI|nr:putative ATP-binding cassette transporter [Podospora australis]
MAHPPGSAISSTVGSNDHTDLNGGPASLDRPLADRNNANPTDKDHRPYSGIDRRASIMTEADASELQALASVLSRHRSNQLGYQESNIDPQGDDPALDPNSEQFEVTKWVQHFVSEIREQGHKPTKLGVSFRSLDVYGSGSALQLQSTVDSVLLSPLRLGQALKHKKQPKHILHGFNGLLQSGELLAVLGRPGSGCSTLLKSLCGELHGLDLGKETVIHYNGSSQVKMKKEFKGEVVYNQEVDKHFPHLTVGQTLEFAAATRTPSQRIYGMSRSECQQYIARVVMAVFGLSHTYHTKVGNDFVRGVSGGERKRVSIAEMMVAGSPICAWDNSTRGLDSSSALKFVQALRISSDIGTSAHAVAMYQASQAIFDLFDKATVLYDGHQIYFGPAASAKAFFERQGWECPSRQTTGDFLTSVTNPDERTPRAGMEDKVPRTAQEFEQYWLASPEFKALQEEQNTYDKEFEGEKQAESLAQLREVKNKKQAKHVRPRSPYIISNLMQVRLNTTRGYQRIWNNLSATGVMILTNIVLALIIGSIFYGNPDATAGFEGKGSVLFMAILLNALTAISEIDALYEQRPMVEKHHSYAFYHPWTEAAAGIVADLPVKFCSAVVFNLIVYLLAGLGRTPSQFFLFFLVSYVTTFVMSAVFRTLAAITKTVSQAMALAGVLALALIIYTGFIIPVSQMHPWFSWIRYINPIFYAFEILIANEFHGRDFTCSNIFPPYSPPQGGSWICAIAGAVPGEWTVSGDAYILATYEYRYSHVWRNFGILVGFLIAFMAGYFIAVEVNSSVTSTAEALVFQRGHIPAHLQQNAADEEAAQAKQAPVEHGPQDLSKSAIEPQKDIFTWKDVVYDIDVKGGEGKRRLLDHVSGWVKPGTLTALMGASGAGKTTLLDVLAQRTTVGVVTGDMLVNGKPFGADFQRQTGYVQQQDLHLDTATVRESLRFSAMLRRPKSVSTKEKYEFVEEVIKMLGMEEYANAVVGVPGQGLNVEQRKLLTIGVELVAKPKLLLFLDEPTSGLDSQSAWAICVFLRKLADAGQAVLCTIHQPNAILFQQFDRLLFLAKGGKTVYFGNIGENSKSLLGYFEAHGARHCNDDENPAEYMLEIVAEGVNDKGEDWNSVWKGSKEFEEVCTELDRIHAAGEKQAPTDDTTQDSNTEFAMALHTQIWAVTRRIFQQYWRMPAYVIPKVALGVMSGLFIGFTFFNAQGTQAGMRDVVFGVFMVTTIFTTLVQQIQPLFVTQRSLYEVRERPSKTYSWKAFIIANVVVEIPYQILTGILTFACFYYPVIGADQSSARQGLILLFTMQLFIYASAFAHMTITALPDAQSAGGLVILLTMMATIFSGVLQTAGALPGFWVFMYYVSPFTYWIGGIVATALHDRPIDCAPDEDLIFPPPQGMNCSTYLEPLSSQLMGSLQNPSATDACRYCSFQVADQYMAGVEIYWSERWRNFAIMWAYILFNIAIAIVTYYLFRVKRWNIKTIILPPVGGSRELLGDLGLAVGIDIVDDGEVVLGVESHFRPISEVRSTGGVECLPARGRRVVSACKFGVVRGGAPLGKIGGSRRRCDQERDD